nr:PREDICTED: uncharacterized protein LOC109042691 isoform X1 [Bemisia tabaci]
MMVDKTGVGPDGSGQGTDPKQQPEEKSSEQSEDEKSKPEQKPEETQPAEKSSGSRTCYYLLPESVCRGFLGQGTKSNQRWMKLRTTVQISSAVGSTKSKPPLKREDSFLKRFSTRQVPQTQETVDTGDDGEGGSGSQSNLDDSSVRRKRRRRLRHPRSVVNPDENFYFYWLLVITVCVLYNLWTLIVRQSFPELQMGYSTLWFSADAFTDVVFLCDIIVQFRTGYLEQGLMVYNSKKLAGHYLKSNSFVLDVLALLPLDLLQFNLGIQPLLRFPRFLKVYRVYDYYYMVESRTVYPNLWRVVNLIHILLVLAHWFGCFYYLLSETEGFKGDWVYPYRPGEYATLSRKYLGSVYWSTLTLTTIGDLPTPETNADSVDASGNWFRNTSFRNIRRKSRLLRFNTNFGYIFTIVSYLIGMFIFATIVGQVGNVITNRNANRLEFERLLDGAKTYMRHHKVPGGMKRRVLRWYDYSWSRGRIQGGGDINTALGLLPDKLKTELALHVNLSVLKKVTIFQECQPEFLHDLVLKMKAYIFTPGDLICRKGEVAREMFIIADGILEVISESGRVLTTMKAGDFFGEIGILNLDGLNKRTADVRSVGYSELFSLSREDVLTAMKDYPEAQEILQSLGRKRLMEARNINRGAKVAGGDKKRKQASPPSPDSGDHKTSKKIVDKIRSDVKGLRNVLRKSRRGTRTKDESLELQPLTNVSGGQSGGHSNKGLLCRMPRVWSDETSQEEDSPAPKDESKGQSKPLLQRLKICKDKQEKDDGERGDEGKRGGAEPEGDAKDKEPEPIGVGLPLLQRLLLLKQKEDREAAEIKAAASNTAEILASTVRTQQQKSPVSKPRKKWKELAPTPCQAAMNQVETTKNTIANSSITKKENVVIKKSADAQASSSCSKPGACGSKENVNAESTGGGGGGAKPPEPKRTNSGTKPWSLLKNATVLSAPPSGAKEPTVMPGTQTPDPAPTPAPTTSTTPNTSLATNLESKHVRINSIAQSFCRDTKKSAEAQLDNKLDIPLRIPFTRKPGVLRVRQGIRMYKSIEDLSPEYSGLPFVKKLKILNERQKLAELERDAFLRSTSLDSSGENENTFDTATLTRSHSEAIAIELVLRNQQSRNAKAARPANLPKTFDPVANTPLVSPESNETQERKHLKSILKKLSSNNLFKKDEEAPQKNQSDPTTAAPAAKIDPNIKRLMRAQTFEGFAARHSKLTKSVTFNRDTLQSPPATAASPTVKDLEVQLCLPVKSTVEEVKSEPLEAPVSSGEERLQTGQVDKSVSPSRNPDLIPDVDRIPTVAEASTPVDVISAQFAMCVAGDAAAPSGGSQQNITCSTQTDSATFDGGTDGGGGAEVFAFPESMSITQFTSVQKSFRPDSLLLPSHSLEEEYFNDILNGIKHVIQGHLEDVQTKFKSKIVNLEQEVRTRDEIIARLQQKIHRLEAGIRHSSESDSDSDMDDSDEYSDQPFMRGDSVDTVVGPSEEGVWVDESGRCGSKTGLRGYQCNRRSWEDHSEEESLELQDLPRSITPQPMWTTVEIGSESSDSPGSLDSEHSVSGSTSEQDLRFRKHDCNWEIQMLARELDRRKTDRVQERRDRDRDRKQRYRKHKPRSTDSNQLSELLSPESGGSQELFVLDPSSLAAYNLNPKLRTRTETVSRSSSNLTLPTVANPIAPPEGLYQKSLSIGSLHSSISSSVRRGFHLLRNSSTTQPPEAAPSTGPPYSPDIVPTISQACLPPPPPPNI